MQSQIPVIAAVLLLLLALAAGGRWTLRRQARRHLARKLDGVIARDFDRLLGIRAQSLRFDAGGALDAEDWRQEIDRFLDSQLSATLSRRELRRLEGCRAELARRVASRVATGVARLPVYQ